MIKIGTQFNSTYADGNCRWTVIEKRGRGTWLAEINADELDWAGTQGAFTTTQIERSIKWSALLEKSSNESDAFFDNLKPGTVVHYHNGFNQYVRCKVTGDHQLLPIALVGKWRELDLPKRESDGSVYLGYHAESIKTGKPFRPHASNMWEFRDGHKTGDIDPTGCVPICLDVPPLTGGQAHEALKHQKLKEIREVVSNNLHPDVIFERLKVLLESA